MRQTAEYTQEPRRPTQPLVFRGPPLYAKLCAFKRTHAQGFMTALLPSLLAALLYLAASTHQGIAFKHRQAPNQRLLGGLGLLALLAQATALQQQLLGGNGLTLDFFNAASLIATSVIGITLLANLRMPVSNLFLLLFPLGALTALLAQWAPTGTSQPINEQGGILAHILLSITAYGLLTLAVFQSLLLMVQDHQLKHKHPSGLIRNFPPLQTMESLLFSFLLAGWLLLSLSLISGWIYVDNLFAQHLAHKTILSCFAWVVFGVLLWGRHQLGWRGHTAIRWTLAGFCLLMLAYFGSKLVREFILHI